jgi:hypothetical protein
MAKQDVLYSSLKLFNRMKGSKAWKGFRSSYPSLVDGRMILSFASGWFRLPLLLEASTIVLSTASNLSSASGRGVRLLLRLYHSGGSSSACKFGR